jgi:hypothetical protein
MSEQVESWKKLSGDWGNQLGSKMTLIADKNGGLRGKYNSAVGEVEDFYTYTHWEVWPSDEGVSVGWVVTYRNHKLNAHSTATWTILRSDGDEWILSHWLLTSSTALSAVWKSTNVGHDTFTRNKLSAAEIAKARALTVGSPHPEDILATR